MKILVELGDSIIGDGEGDRPESVIGPEAD
jgi:hypothetical protein